MNPKYEIDGEDNPEVRFAIAVLKDHLTRAADLAEQAAKCLSMAELLKTRIDYMRAERPERERRTWWMRLPKDRHHGHLGIPDPNAPVTAPGK